MEDFRGRVAFITGGASGIGLGIARALAAQGVSLAIVDINQAALAAAQTELEAVTPTGTWVLDVRDRESYARVAEEVEASLGPVSLLFNNAGVAMGSKIAEMSLEAWDTGLGVNLTGVVNGIHAFVPAMIERGDRGYIVNTASGAGLVAAPTALYSTAKFAVVGMSESLSQELAEHGIGVSVLCPGPVATNIIDNTSSFRGELDELVTDPDEIENRGYMRALLANGVRPDDVGHMVVEAMRAAQLHIHTDGIMRFGVERRTEMILSTMPLDAPVWG